MIQKIIEGIEQLPHIIKDSNCKNMLLVAGSSFQYLQIKEIINQLPIKKKVFSDFTPNPLYEQICKGVDVFKKESCDVIVAIGGGSAIDVAKCIKLAVLAAEGLNAIIPPLVNQKVPINGRSIPLIAIPTTAGTGSESTSNAVIYYNGEKQTVANDELMPNFAILEPSVLESLPIYQKKCTMMDALCQGIESWWSVNSTEESREYSRTAIKLIIMNWKDYIFNNDRNAAALIMLGANYSGRAINISQTTAAHAMSYKITSLYGLPHGHAVSICLPVLWKYMYYHFEKCLDLRGKTYLKNIFFDIANAINTNSTLEAIQYINNMISTLALHTPAAADRDAEISQLSISVNPIRLKNNPIEIDDDTIKTMYEQIIH